MSQLRIFDTVQCLTLPANCALTPTIISFACFGYRRYLLKLHPDHCSNPHLLSSGWVSLHQALTQYHRRHLLSLPSRHFKMLDGNCYCSLYSLSILAVEVDCYCRCMSHHSIGVFHCSAQWGRVSIANYSFALRHLPHLLPGRLLASIWHLLQCQSGGRQVSWFLFHWRAKLVSIRIHRSS